MKDVTDHHRSSLVALQFMWGYVADRAWCPAELPPIPGHGGLGEKGEKVVKEWYWQLENFITSNILFLLIVTIDWEQDHG